MEQSQVIAQLTPREREVLELLRLGLTDAEMARRLAISRSAVSHHVSEIIAKLDVRNRYEAAYYPGRPPWWMAAVAPIALVLRRVTGRMPGAVAWTAMAAALALFAAALAGIGVLAYFLTRGGDEGPVSDGTLNVPYDAIASLTNYAFTTDLHITSPDTDFSVTFDGTFQAPDRVQGTIAVSGEPYERLLTELLQQPAESEVVVIGQDAWWRDEAGEWHDAQDLSEEARNPLIVFREYASPEFYLEALQFEALSLPVAGATVEVNGVDAVPVRLDKQAIADLLPQGKAIKIYPDPDDYNEVFPSIIENAQQVLPPGFLVEAWFAEEDGRPVRIVFDYSVTGDDYSNLAFGFGVPADIRLQLDITDPEADREIEAPLPVPTEVPTPSLPTPEPGTPDVIPSLTEEDKQRIEEIALADPLMQELLAGHRYEVTEPFFVWHSERLEKLGGGFYITFAEPFDFAGDWPQAIYDDSEQTSPPFRLAYARYRVEALRKVSVLVYLPAEKLAEIQVEEGTIIGVTPAVPE